MKIMKKKGVMHMIGSSLICSVSLIIWLSLSLVACGGGENTPIEPTLTEGEIQNGESKESRSNGSLDLVTNSNIASVLNAKILTDPNNDRRGNYSLDGDQPVQFAELGNGEMYAAWIISAGDGVEYLSPNNARHLVLAYATALDDSQLELKINGEFNQTIGLTRNFASDYYSPLDNYQSHVQITLDWALVKGDRVQLVYPEAGPAASIGSLAFYETFEEINPSPWPEPDLTRAPIEDSIASTITGINYPITVFLPFGYYDTEFDYPVIYVLDGQFHKPHFSYVVRMLGIQAIVVAIDEGPTGRRATDYLAPGVFSYYGFLSNELLPHIESSYRIDESKRSITGASASGLAVGLILLEEPVEAPLFKNYFSFDGPFYSISARALTDKLNARIAKGNNFKGRVIFASATLPGDIPPFDSNVRRFKGHLESSFSSLEIYHRSYPVNHFNSTGPSWPDFVHFTTR